MSALTPTQLKALVDIFSISMVYQCGELSDHIMDSNSRFSGAETLTKVVEPLQALEVITERKLCGKGGRKCLFECGPELLNLLYQEENVHGKVILDEEIVILALDSNFQEMQGLPLRLDSMVLTIDQGSMLEWYALPHGKVASLKLARLQELNTHRTISKTQFSIKPIWERRKDMQATLFNVGIVEYPYPGNVLQSDGSYKGWEVSKTEALAEALNFTVKFVVPDDGKWGSEEADGNWNGLVGSMLSEQTDFIGPIGVLESRAHVLSYSASVYTSPITMIIPTREKGNETVDFLVFLNVLQLKAWQGLLLCILLTAGLYSLLHRMAAVHSNRSYNVLLALDFGMHSVILSLLQQQSDTVQEQCAQGRKNKNQFTTRIVYLTTNLSMFLIFVVYSSDLTARMTAGAPEAVPNSFQDVYKYSYTLVYLKDTAEEKILSSGPEGTFKQKVFEERSKGVTSVAELIDELVTGDKVVGFHYHDSHVATGPELGVKSNPKFDEPYNLVGAFALPKDSPLLKLFNYHVSRLKQFGVWRKITGEWIHKRKPQDSSHSYFVGDAFPLGYSNLVSLVVVLLVGVGVTFLVLVAERYVIMLKMQRINTD